MNSKTPCLKHGDRRAVALELHGSREMLGEAVSEEIMAGKILQLQKGLCVQVKDADSCQTLVTTDRLYIYTKGQS